MTLSITGLPRLSVRSASPVVNAARVYPFAFVGAGLVAEAGLLVSRSLLATSMGMGMGTSLAAELARDGFSYGYVAVAVTVGLGLLGRFLGTREDALRATSVTDALTDVINRRGVDAALAREVARAHEARMPLALLVLDIDHFKRLNDELGHQAGDLALQRLGEVLRATCRSRDVPGRLGGDEFVVILPRTTADEAEVLAERIRDTLATHPFTSPWRAGLDRRFELSIGVASLDDVAIQTPEALIQAADRALYQAKADGRNRVARSLPAQRIVLSLPPQVAQNCTPPGPVCAEDANHELARPLNMGYASCANSNSDNLLRTPAPFRAPSFSRRGGEGEGAAAHEGAPDSVDDADPVEESRVGKLTGAGATTRRAAT